MKLRSFVVLLMAAFVVLCATASAQEFRATISGRVADASGAGVPNAKVVVHNVSTNEDFSATTNEDGNYTVSFLIPGQYTVSAEAPGFKKQTRQNIELHVNDKVSVDVNMQVGDVAESVTVTEAPPLLETETASRGGVIENLRVTELPLNGRNPFMLSNLTPGVIFNGNPVFTRPFDNGDNANFSINGGLRQTNEFLIDGMPDNAVTDTAGDRSHANQNVAYIPTVDATQEFKIVTNFYDAQYGRTGGGVINVTTKSGTNQFHGTAYEFLRRYQLDANSFSQNTAGKPRYSVDPITGANLGGHKLDQYGGVFSGPVWIPKVYNGKDKTFFTFAVENYNESTPSPSITNVPSLAMRNGDFSKAGVAIYDPFSTALNPAFDASKAESASNPRYLRTQFDNNMIPAAKMNAVGLGIIKSYPVPNTGAPDAISNNYYTGANLSADHFRNWLGRVDQSFGQKERMFFRYAHNRRNQVDNGSSNFQGPGLDAQDPLVRLNDNAVVDSVTVLSANMVLNLRAGLSRYIEQALRQRVFGYDITQLGFSQAYANSRFDPIPPRIDVDGDYPSWGTRNQRYNVNNVLSFQPSLSWIKGKHSLKFGGDYRDLRVNTASGSFVYGGGQFHFTKGYTQRVPNFAESGVGNAFASLVLGVPNDGIISYTPALAYRWGYTGLYVQDDIKLTQRLTVNLGLRWDVEGAPTERYNRQNRGWNFTAASPLAAAVKNANPTDCPTCANLTGGLLFAGSNGQPREAFNTDYNHFQPRIGAAYQIARNTVLRGGFGMFYLPEAAFGGVAGFAADTSFISTTGSGVNSFIPQNTLSNPFPNGLFQPVGTAQGLLTFAGQNIIFNDPNRKIPHANQFSFGIEHQLPGAVKLEASYVGSRTYDVNTNDNQAGGARNINALSADQLAKARQDSTYLTASVPNPFAGLLPGTNLNGATVQRQLLLKPYPQFGNVLIGQESIGKIWYDSLQVSVEKRYSAGLVLVGAYTFSKNLEAVSFANPQDAAPTKNLTSNDRPQRLVLSGVYQLPFGRGKKFANTIGPWANLLIGGWEYNFIGTLQSGTPMDLPGGAYILKNPSLSNQTTNFWFNTCVLNVAGTAATMPDPAHKGFSTACTDPAWQLRGPNTLRTTQFRTGDVRYPWAKQWDMSLNKNFYVSERWNAQFRFETFNTFNTPIRNNPNTDITSSNFGFVPANQSNFPRNIQLGFKVNF